jgi:hypothetical protein
VSFRIHLSSTNRSRKRTTIYEDLSWQSCLVSGTTIRLRFTTVQQLALFCTIFGNQTIFGIRITPPKAGPKATIPDGTTMNVIQGSPSDPKCGLDLTATIDIHSNISIKFIVRYNAPLYWRIFNRFNYLLYQNVTPDQSAAQPETQQTMIGNDDNFYIGQSFPYGNKDDFYRITKITPRYIQAKRIANTDPESILIWHDIIELRKIIRAYNGF